MQISNTSNTPMSLISFTISGINLEPDIVSQTLDMIPSRVYLKGNSPGGEGTKPYDYSMWALDSKLSEETPFIDHLASLLSSLEPKREQIMELAKENNIYFYCTLYAQIGIELSPSLLESIADIGATLGITVYS